ncbi:uncharacterized protein [Rutidosis leptorrhynchoides]|uniref:uncharacterized protein n=1 Tax=Rutidosis leptorrhynchoides TaxID=125765 RepID=UPI003A99C5D5
MDYSERSPSAQELLKRILELEERHAQIKPEISKRMLSAASHKQAISRQVYIKTHGGGFTEPLAMVLREHQYLNILQSLGQSVHIYDHNHRIFFWNHGAERIFGYSAEEVHGRSPLDFIIEPKNAQAAIFVIERALHGESWSGVFPIKNKHGERFLIIVANTPFRDDNNRIIGAMALCSDSRLYQVKEVGMGITVPTTFTYIQHLKTSTPSEISNSVKLKMETEDDYTDDEGGSDITDQSESNTRMGHISLSPFGVFFSMDTNDHLTRILYGDTTENKLGRIYKFLLTKVKALKGRKGISLPWKLSERNNESLDAKLGQEPEPEPGPNINSTPAKQDHKLSVNKNMENDKFEATRLWISQLPISSGNGSFESNDIVKFERKPESLEYEILWEDLFIRAWIGEGSLGTVYQGLLYGLDVVVKLFKYQEFSDDITISFKHEISIMKRLRHPNVLLIKGAVTSPPNLCIVTEFLPRGSLFQILHCNTIQLNWRRRFQMSVDIARGMNYLHSCNPPIVHSDLKSSDILVDKNWSVKVGDCGLSRIKHQTYLKTKIWKGEPQWMAPEVLRNELADDKSDVYSYGVVLWELTTEKIPWDGLNVMQIVGTVGFSNQTLEIPKDVDPQWASLIKSCWSREPQSRPCFQDILYKLKGFQKKFAAERK